MRSVRSPEEKERLVLEANLCKRGELKALLARVGLSSSTLDAWRRFYAKGGIEALYRKKSGPKPDLLRKEQSRRGGLAEMTEDQRTRFWQKVDKTGPLFRGSPCWVWLGGKDSHGYGGFSLPGRRSVLAHRAAYALSGRKLSLKAPLDHLCRNPACVNPAHLEQVTPRENIRRGINTRLTKDLVEEMRALHQKGLRQAELARKYGVSRPYVSRVVRGLAWSE